MAWWSSRYRPPAGSTSVLKATTPTSAPTFRFRRRRPTTTGVGARPDQSTAAVRRCRSSATTAASDSARSKLGARNTIQRRGAERAPPRRDWHLAQTLGTLLGRRIGRSLAPMDSCRERVHGGDDEEIDRGADHQERHDGVDEIAEEELAAVDSKRNR